jgi:NAD(P)-dependent dehydrogenase (short-subunit alcohol dehydrogenase family)
VTGVAVITGAASGFGRALAAGCAANGLHVALLDLDGERAANEAEAIEAELGTTAIGIPIDVADADSVTEASTAVAERFGRADLVISNVGVQLFGSIDRATDDEWRWVLDVNVVGSARVVRAFLPMLRAAPSPHLAFTSSSSVLDPASRMSMYQSSKFAVWGLAESLRVELAPSRIPVTVLLPSGMLSRHLETSEAAQPAHLRRPVVVGDDLDVVIGSNPAMAGFLATPEDAAGGVIERILAGDPYVITHGDFTDAIDRRAAMLHAASVRSTSDAT